MIEIYSIVSLEPIASIQIIATIVNNSRNASIIQLAGMCDKLNHICNVPSNVRSRPMKKEVLRSAVKFNYDRIYSEHRPDKPNFSKGTCLAITDMDLIMYDLN